MQAAALPDYEEQRLEALYRLNILDTPAEEAFDELARLVRSHFKAEISTIALVDEKRVWFKSAIGIEVDEVPREESLCAHVILNGDLLCVQDSHKEDHFFDHPPKHEGKEVRFYAGIPLSVEGGINVGCLSVLGVEPREFSRQDYVDLKRFGRAVERLLAQSSYEQDQRFLVSQTMRLNTLLETIADGIVTIDAKGEIESINPAAASIFGYERDDLIGVHFNQLMPDLGGGGWIGYEKRVLNQDVKESDKAPLDLQGRRKDGSMFPMDLRIRDMWLDGQRLYTGIIRDITYEKSIQDEIRKGREILETTKDNIPIGITVFDEKGRLIVFNNSFSELLDLPDELVSRGTSMYRILGYVINRGDLGDWESVRTKGELEALLKSGDKKHYLQTKSNKKHIEISTRPMPGGGYVSLYSDLTLRLQYEERLEKALDEANRANQAKTNFLSTISHEIRTPLNGVIGVSQMLSDTELTGEQSEKVDAILRSGTTLLGLINDVLDMNKIESGNLEVEEITYDLHEVFHSMESPFRLQAQEKGIEYASDIDSDVPELMVGDPVRLRQVVMNLIGNAVKFTAKGSVTLSVSSKSHEDGYQYLSIRVADTGVGIPADRQETVFDSFSQADTSVSRKFGGTGLGLSIVRKLVELLGGDVSLESEDGIGSVFTVLLPEKIPTEAQEKEFRKKQQAKNVVVTKSLKVLVAEDNEVNAMVTEAFLKDIGATSVVAENGLYAVDKFGEDVFDLVLMDIHMPEMDGIEATKLIRTREDGRNVPIIGLTAEAFTDRHSIFKEAGMDDVLTKPMTKGQLQQVVMSYFDEHFELTKSTSAETMDTPEVPSSDEGKSETESCHALFVPSLKQPIGGQEKLDEYVEQLGADVTLSLISKTPASISNELGNLKTAFEEQDQSVIYRSIHTIAGVSASMGGERLAQQASIMEKQSDDIELIAEMMDDFLSTASETIAWWENAVDELSL